MNGQAIEGAGAGGSLALVHEWIEARAGSEQVFEALAGIFPRADLFALTANPGVELQLGGRQVRTTCLDKPWLRRRRDLTLPLMPLAWRCLDTRTYDAVITSHHAFAHTNRLARRVHLAYVHTPARYVWSPDLDRRGAGGLLAVPRLALKALDRRAARRVTAYAANSREVADRIRRFWNRDAVVIHPPVRTEFFTPDPSVRPSRDYVLGVGRWIGYKNLHLVIDAASAAGVPVKIAGRGPERKRLEAAAESARVPVEIIEGPSDEQLRDLYRNAVALVFPTAEDFGLVPVEAQASGTPVVALGQGGALDTVADGVTGVLTASCDATELARGIAAAASLNGADCVRQAEGFGSEAFARRVLDWAGAWAVTP